MFDLAKATAADFEATLNEVWTLHADGKVFPFTMAAVRSAGEPRSPDLRKPFTVLLRSRDPIRVPQRTHRFEHERLGQVEMFVVQTSPTELEAVFS